MSVGLEERLRRVEDELELYRLVARYAVAVDDRDRATLSELYASDAEFNGRDRVVRGRNAVVNYLCEQTASYGPSIHVPQSLLITWFDDDHASGLATGAAELSLFGKRLLAAFRYYDDYVREDSQWRFRRRDIQFIYAAPTEELAEIYAGELRKRWPGAEPAPADIPETLSTWRESKGL
jgi:hypothetical protein